MKAYSQITTLQTQMQPTDWSLLCRRNCSLQTGRYSADAIVAYRLVVTLQKNGAYRLVVTLQTQL
jgi:hypothetical protein